MTCGYTPLLLTPLSPPPPLSQPRLMPRQHRLADKHVETEADKSCPALPSVTQAETQVMGLNSRPVTLTAVAADAAGDELLPSTTVEATVPTSGTSPLQHQAAAPPRR